MHGMPLAALINADNLKFKKNQVSEEEADAWNRLKSIGSKSIAPKIKPEDIVFIGLRDAEKEEWGLIEELGIKTFEPQDIKEHGIFFAINNALKHLEPCDLIYVSFDVDSMDPSVSIGTGTTSPDGLSFVEAEGVFKTFLNHPKLVAFEITEINPSLDEEGNKMADIVAALLNYAFK
jgi:arginase